MVLSGTHVMEGSGKIVITAVGVNSQAGIIFTLLGATDDEHDTEKKKVKKGKSCLDMRFNKRHNVIICFIYIVPANGQKNGIKSESNHVESPAPASSGEGEKSVLQAKLTKLAIQIGYAGSSIAAITVIILIIQFCVQTFVVEQKPWKNSYANNFVNHLIIGVTVLVVAVPEGLPLAVTLSLAYSVKVR